MNGPGFDFDTGFGFIQADTALAKVRDDAKDPGHPYVDANHDGWFTDGIDVPLINGERQDGRFDTRVSEGGYDAARSLILRAETGNITATDGDTLQVDQPQGDLTLEAGGNIDVSNSTVNGASWLTLSVGGGLTAQGATR
jgi:hypothetical protein